MRGINCAVSKKGNLFITSSDGRVVRASASEAGDSEAGLIPSQVKPTTLKSVFTAFLLDAQH